MQELSPIQQKYKANKAYPQKQQDLEDVCKKCKRHIHKNELIYRDVMTASLAHVTCPKKDALEALRKSMEAA